MLKGGADVHVCVSDAMGVGVEQIEERGGKRCRGACVTSLWKSIDSAARTLHHIAHAYKCTRAELQHSGE